MTTFDEREQAFEAKFAHDEEMQFKARARRNRMLGLWAADLLGKTGSSANEYAQSIVAADLEEAGHEDVVRKLTSDLGSRASEEQIRLKLQELLVQAQADILKETS
ncbi:DUF1476 domain-containing protein [Leisingera daeponensis]|uniref:DUF1476 domain-containing protein n=1 Tax=Leisingera daeponensis TaxID=405746 RepID=UPI000183C0B0|nr:DUF1476 domain-containing protein [Leisingera daeponensis]EDZ47755.1 conserved hypothetical protein [Rhodobacterales bacterium Y4I]